MNVVERVQRVKTGSRLVLRCLGRFRLESAAGDQLQIRTRKARAMLAALALSGRPMSRESLADLLWSDRGAVQAKSSVRQTVFELQHLQIAKGAILSASRDVVTFRSDLIVTDLQLIKSASDEADWANLLALLEDTEPGLLTDLDGLDAEFDSWLRIHRVHEVPKALTAAVAAAERSLAEAGPRTALELVTEILRIDPANEEAVRLALRIDHKTGDNGALHRHYRTFRERLLEEYDAEPSPETVTLFNQLTGGRREELTQETESIAAAGTADEPSVQGRGRRSGARTAVTALALVAALAAAFAILIWRDAYAREAARDPVLLAVLPFDHLPKGDDFLAEGLWEDTRTALARNSGLRVLGRSTIKATETDRLTPEQYRGRFGVDYLLEGSIRRNASQVLVSVSLTRTADGVAIWDGAFRGRMDEPLVLQYAIANGIEGKLRGRLARGGGRRAEQIATTPAVFALYSEARQLIASRQGASFPRAEALLRQAVASDPNFAPGWSSLAAAIYFNSRGAIDDGRARQEGVLAARRSLALAPNLAQAYASSALLEGESSPYAERLLRTAVALDPSDTEAWTWLGNALNSRHRPREAIAAYERAIAIDPLFSPPVQNLAATAAELQDQATLRRLLERLSRAGASRELIFSVRSDALHSSGDYSGAARVLLQLGSDGQGQAPQVARSAWFSALTALGYYELLHKVTACPDWYGPLLRGTGLPPSTFEGREVTPKEFFTSFFFSNAAARTMVNRGHGSEVIRLYRAGFKNPDDFIARTRDRGLFTGLAPTLSATLSSNGSPAEALYILSAAANQLEPRRGQAATRGATAELAAVRAAQGEREQSLRLLNEALQRGWLPDGRAMALDISQEPAFHALRGEPRFEQARKLILTHVARERAELGPIKI